MDEFYQRDTKDLGTRIARTERFFRYSQNIPYFPLRNVRVQKEEHASLHACA
jgi:hypothetical protein